MSSWGAHDEQNEQVPASSWQSLSGEALPPVPSFGAEPIADGRQQVWQDEQGQLHYPYGELQQPQAPPYEQAAQELVQVQPDPTEYATPAAPATAPAFVTPEQLAPVGPPRYLAPTKARQDPRQRTMATVIVFVCLLMSLWAILGFMGSLSDTMASIASGSDKLKLQLVVANKGLVKLDAKTARLEQMTADSAKLQTELDAIDQDMGSMLEGVDVIAANMSSMEDSLATLDAELAEVNDINTSMSAQLASINAGLKAQVAQVRTMRRDVQATGGVLGTLKGRLSATNGRLAHVNKVVNVMGCQGITNNLKVKISLGPIPNGSASVYATVIPPGAWGTKDDGVTPC